MADFKNVMQDQVGLKTQHSSLVNILPATVTASDEKNNTCSIEYTDMNGISRNKDNVAIRLYGSGTDYFPAINDSVLVEESYGTCVVIARNVSNYAMDVRSKMELEHDIYSDNIGAIGGCLF